MSNLTIITSSCLTQGTHGAAQRHGDAEVEVPPEEVGPHVAGGAAGGTAQGEEAQGHARLKVKVVGKGEGHLWWVG